MSIYLRTRNFDLEKTANNKYGQTVFRSGSFFEIRDLSSPLRTQLLTPAIRRSTRTTIYGTHEAFFFETRRYRRSIRKRKKRV